MNANPILLQKKYSRVIECFADKMNISLNAALDFFYRSEVYCLMRDGVSDMHLKINLYYSRKKLWIIQVYHYKFVIAACFTSGNFTDSHELPYRDYLLRSHCREYL